MSPAGAAAHPEEAGGADYPAGPAGEGELPEGEGQPGRHAAEGTLVIRTPMLSSLLEVSANADVCCPVSQEKENLSALERKYADLTGGRSFTLREVGHSDLVLLKLLRTLKVVTAVVPLKKNTKMGGLSPSSASTRNVPHWPTSVGRPAVAGATRLLPTRSARALSRPSFPLFF